MAAKKRSTVLVLALGAAALAWWLSRRRAPVVTPGTGSGTHNVAVDDAGNPQPGPGYWLEIGPDGSKRWSPISALN